MKRLKLTNTILTALVDDEDYSRCSVFNWYLHPEGSVRSTQRLNNNQHIGLASFILNTTVMIDHKDINGLNNQKSNLRICTDSQNQANRKKLKYINNSSKYKGVSLDPRTGKFQSRITVNGKTIHLGTFSTEELAAKRYNGAAKKHFGEFARLNEFNEQIQ